jgi:hypothetical protein
MYDDVRHRGAWLPAEARLDRDASKRMAEWINANVPNLRNRVVVTPVLGNPVDTPPVLASLAKGVPHKSGSGGGPDWQWSSGPVVVAWPTVRTLERCVPMATDQTLILFEWSTPSFLGWATATAAFNAATGETTPPLAKDLHDEFRRTVYYDRELVGGARRGKDRERPQRHLCNLHDSGLDEDFVVTYTLALNEQIDPKHIREHYRAAIVQASRR